MRSPLADISENGDTGTVRRELLGDLASNVSAEIKKIVSEPLDRDQKERGAMLERRAHDVNGIPARSQFPTLRRKFEDSDSRFFQNRIGHLSDLVPRTPV